VAKQRSVEDDLAEVAMKRAGHEVLRCPKCDRVIMDDVPICRACGHKFGRYAPRFPLKKVLIALVIAAVVIAFVLLP
jgi:uncharacterized C2H2 Zn-finger protein